ncbi:MAG: DUF4974 domain-containing protein [Cyclobacteriaceae bacterium]|jgi:hypothetical protein
MNLVNLIRKCLLENATKFKRATWEKLDFINKSSLQEIENDRLLLDSELKENDFSNLPPYEGLLKIKERYRDQKRRSKQFRDTIAICVFTVVVFSILLISSRSNRINYVHFDQVPIRNMFIILKNRYSVIIEAEDCVVLNCRFTGTFSNVATEEIVTSMASSLGLGFERVGERGYRLTGSNCI